MRNEANDENEKLKHDGTGNEHVIQFQIKRDKWMRIYEMMI